MADPETHIFERSLRLRTLMDGFVVALLLEDTDKQAAIRAEFKPLWEAEDPPLVAPDLFIKAKEPAP
jgi:hypothetical protein